MPYFILFFSLLFTTPTFSQNSFDVAGCWGGGITFPSVNSYFEELDQSVPLRISPNFHVGINTQYIIGNKFGIEAGALTSMQEYIIRPNTYKMRMLDSYIPIQILYRIDHPTNPYHHFTFLAGTGLHWLNLDNPGSDNIADISNTLFIPCINIGVRMGGEKRRAGRLEYGFDYQFSPNGQYEISTIDGSGTVTTLHSTISPLSFKIFYFFLNKRLSKDAEG